MCQTHKYKPIKRDEEPKIYQPDYESKIDLAPCTDWWCCRGCCCLSFLYNHTTRLSLWKKGAHFISVLNQHSTILSHRLTCPWSGMFFCYERKWNNVHTYFAEMLLLLQAKLSHPFYFIQFSLSSSVWAVLWTWNFQVQNGPHFRPDCNCNLRAMYHFEHLPPECGDGCVTLW